MSNYLFKPSAQTLPYANVNGAYVNKFNTNWSGSFSSNESPARFGLPEPVNKDQAAIPYIKGMGLKGGSKRHSSYKKNLCVNIRKWLDALQNLDALNDLLRRDALEDP